jgi:limonene-1,2-epoxide hydrolase
MINYGWAIAMAKATWLQAFISVYSELKADNLQQLKGIYHSEVVFIDPMHQMQGRKELLSYFERLYREVISCDFIIEEVLEVGDEAAIFWTMMLRHKQLAGGRKIKLEGHSHLKVQEGQIIYHRDYFDVGAMLYEHIPLLGRVIKFIKHRAGK